MLEIDSYSIIVPAINQLKKEKQLKRLKFIERLVKD
jgi:hypothetical protein